jgi:hypothetical protein
MEDSAFIIPVHTLEGIQNQITELTKIVLEIRNKGKTENLTFKEVMQILKCSRNTVNAYVEKGYFNSYQTGGKYSKIIFKRSEIEFFQDHRKRE